MLRRRNLGNETHNKAIIGAIVFGYGYRLLYGVIVFEYRLSFYYTGNRLRILHAPVKWNFLLS